MRVQRNAQGRSVRLRGGCAAGLCLWFGLAQAEVVEILYEQGGADERVSQWWWWLAGLSLVGVGTLLALLYWRVRRHLEQRQEAVQQAEARLREAQLIARIGSWSRDFETGQTFWSEEACKVLELAGEAESIGHYERLVHPEDLDKVTEAIANAYHQGGHYQCDHRVICPNGAEKYVRLTGRVYLNEGFLPVRETGTVQDISDRRQTDQALLDSERHLRIILDATPYPILILEASEALPVLYANRAAFEQGGRPVPVATDVLKGRDLWGDGWLEEVLLPRLRKDRQVRDLEVRLRRESGEECWVQVSASLMEFAGSRALFVTRVDVTQRHQAQQALERLATTDPLTGQLNRRYFLESAAREFKRALRYQQPFTLLMLDLDHFRRVNDSYGHAFGDDVLRRFAETARTCLREEDLLGRVGGEEFCALLTASAEEGGYLVAERIRKRWQDEVFVQGGARFNLTVSVGVSSLTGGQDTLAAIMERADAALYGAKRAGRNCVIVHNGERAPEPLRQQSPG